MDTLNNPSGEQPRHRGPFQREDVHVENVGNAVSPVVANCPQGETVDKQYFLFSFQKRFSHEHTPHPIGDLKAALA